MNLLRSGKRAAILFGIAFGTARGDNFNGFCLINHDAHGEGWANVFDGGPADFETGATTGPEDDHMTFLAGDDTQPGANGAHATATGRSSISPFNQDSLRVRLTLGAEYLPSLNPGGDNVGGAAEADLSSIIQFTLPSAGLDSWEYELRILNTEDFDGSTSIIFENLTSAETLLTLTEQVFPGVQGPPLGQPGDLIQIATMMNGSGSTPPRGIRNYHALFDSQFVIPEPRTISILVFGGLIGIYSTQRRNSHVNKHELSA